MRVVVTGATGRMGREVIDAAREAGHDVVAVSHSASGEIGGVEIEPAREFPTLLEEHEPDAAIDFTLPDPSVSYVWDCAEAGVPAVVGTTGFSEAQHGELREASEAVPVLQAANFARGVQGLLSAVREAVAALPEYDVELTETHHNGKRDAPSGTANRVLDAIDETRGDSLRVHGREGEAPREAGEIGVHARRAGDISGEHEVLLAGNHEELRLTHRAGSRGVFAAGALDAAEWLAGRSPGWYDFSDTLPDSES
ncbi:4-hydroxy-tetrahydrodipicolinate reductase [Halalkalicoccus jeotgali]|uniref:4-hydroxy-tetrahydrodipicolinate reductase n=1 Tax=Halalkalicoccus jeotgali (strain DSM 18796 / CECT 7217 / JCM 14584 / KCTC 4019 / B3) TaxID=795797 RepID=D8J898_HALJB|nr:4-hydroxy-tetrahydrodipicolinate reductase [Halalkalicoccus jeotgali]ADJ16144.1 dihydrodipicolinate reductase [Halalkalicoccus jeotgali B3]ELY37573.1 dihydrodipicolinate reductase [Halalkalicoccus jeotgali B3]